MAAPLELIANNLKHVYPRPAISQAWLAETLAELLARSPDLSRQLQVKGCHQALLRSHLGQSTAAGTGFPPALVDTADDTEPLHDQLVFKGIKGCLVMVVGITEVGSSAFHLRKNLNERREARKGTARIRRLAGEDDDEDEDDAEANMRYPRGMLKLELSDGFSVCKAIEYKRMSAFKLGETRLGTKVLLRNVRVLRGVLLLTPETCAVKSEPADGLYDERRDEDEFDRGLMERLGIDQEQPEEALPNARSPSPLAPPRDDEFDDYIPDDFDLPDALGPNPIAAAPPRAPARAAAPPPAAARPPPAAAPTRAPPASAPPPPDDDPFDDIDEDALIAAAEADAAEEELALIREYEPPPPSPPRPPAARPQPSPARPARPPPRASAAPPSPLFVPPPRPSRSTAQPSQAQAGPSSSSSRRLPAAPRPPRPASPDKPLFPPFTIVSGSGAKRPTAASAAASKASSSSQRPTSQLEPLVISSSPEPELAPSPPPRRKAPIKREATAPAVGAQSARGGGSSGSGATAAVAPAPAGKRIKGRPKPDVEVIEID